MSTPYMRGASAGPTLLAPHIGHSLSHSEASAPAPSGASAAAVAKASFLMKAIYIMGMLVSGSVNTLAKKSQNQAVAIGADGKEHAFHKPWFQTAQMFLGEFSCLVVYAILSVYTRHRERMELAGGSLQQQGAPLLSPGDQPGRPAAATKAAARPVATAATSARTLLYMLPATMMDICGTTAAGIGLLYVPASVYQMVRGAIVIFSAVLSKIFLKRQIETYKWVGICILVVGLGLVGTSAIMNESGHKSDHLVLGLVLILLGQLFSAGQFVYEEALLKRQALAPLMIVGTEGAFGFLIMCAAVLPLVTWGIHGDDHGSYENAPDALDQIHHSPKLLAFVILYIFSIAFYNVFGMLVTRQLTAVHRTLIDALRTTVVWCVELFLFYALDSPRYGEQWTKWSFLELGGFVFLIWGTLVYNNVVQLPIGDLYALLDDDDDDDDDDEEEEEEEDMGSTSSEALSPPHLSEPLLDFLDG